MGWWLRQKHGRMTKTVFPPQFSGLGPHGNTIPTKTEGLGPCGSSQWSLALQLTKALLLHPYTTVSMFKVSQHLPSRAGRVASAQNPHPQVQRPEPIINRFRLSSSVSRYITL